MTQRLYILIIVLAIGFGSMALIPDSPPTEKAAIEMKLPTRLVGWTGVEVEPTQVEIETLAIDTEFEKKTYYQFRDPVGIEQFDGVHVSIVLSGADVNNSIHRPERCMPSQGFRDLKISRREITGSDGKHSVRRIQASRVYQTKGEGSDGVELESIIYYWFVGATSVTDSHYTRTFIDMRDRIFKGYDQRWAYITVSAVVTSGLDKVLGRSEEETERIVKRFSQSVFNESVTAGK